MFTLVEPRMSKTKMTEDLVSRELCFQDGALSPCRLRVNHRRARGGVSQSVLNIKKKLLVLVPFLKVFPHEIIAFKIKILCAYLYMCVCVHVQRPAVKTGLLLGLFSALFFKAGSLTEPGTSLFS